MHEVHEQIASDLEYLLASGAAEAGERVEALVEEYYGPVYRLSLGVLNNDPAAYRAALQANRSPGETGVAGRLHAVLCLVPFEIAAQAEFPTDLKQNFLKRAGEEIAQHASAAFAGSLPGPHRCWPELAIPALTGNS